MDNISLRLISNKVIIKLDVFSPFVKDRIRGNVKCELVVTKNDNRTKRGQTKFLKKIENPLSLISGLC